MAPTKANAAHTASMFSFKAMSTRGLPRCWTRSSYTKVQGWTEVDNVLPRQTFPDRRVSLSFRCGRDRNGRRTMGL